MSVRGLMAALAAALLCASAGATDYCIDPVAGSDTATGRCADRAWATLGPSQTFPFVSGDRVLLSAGRHVHPLTQWYMKPGVSWIGAGRDRTTVVYNKTVNVPFVRFRTGTGGSGPPGDLRPQAFTNATVVSDMTIVNEGQATIGIDVASTSGDSAPLLTRLNVVSFPTGILLHPSSDERAAASTHALVTQSIIRGSGVSGLEFFSDVFYARAVTEGSTARNVSVQAAGVAAAVKTQIQDMRDAANASAAPILTNDTLSGAGEAALLLVSYYNNGSGAVREQRNAGATGATVRGCILTGSAGHGVREHSPFTEPAVLDGNSLGGNAIGDYLDEGTTLRAAPAVGTGNVSATASFVDVAGGDLHVMAGSPTIDRLAPASAPPDDVDAQSRPQGAMSDMGADEWVACAARADATATRQAAACTGGTSTLDATLSSIDAACTGGATYEWWDGATRIATTPTFDVSPAVATTYRLRVRCSDSALSACFADTTVTVQPSTTRPIVSAGAASTACAAPGDVVVFDLSGAAAAVAPSVLSTTLWTTTAGTIASPSSPSTTLSVTATAAAQVVTVTFTATDDQACSAQDVIAFRVDPEPSVTITAPATECHDAAAPSSFVDVAAVDSGGTAPFSHAWTASDGVITGVAPARLTLPGSPVSRSVTVDVITTDDRGCTATATTTIRFVPNPVADAGADGTACGEIGTPAMAPLDGSATTGEAPLTYAWSAAEGVVADPSAAITSLSVDVQPSPRPVVVTLEVSDATGACRSTDTRVVTVGPGPVARAGDDLDQCASPGTLSVPLDGSASSGVPPLTYRWTTTAGTIVNPSSALATLDLPVGASPVTAIVTLEVTDARATCSGSDQRVITAGPGAVAVAGADSVECSGSSSIVVPLDGSASTGDAPLTFEWSATEGTVADPSSATTTLTIPGGAARTVRATLRVHDARGTCPGTDDRDIRVSPRATASAGGPYSAVQGAGDTRLPIDGASGGGEPPLTWSWTTDLGTFEDTGLSTSALPSPALLVPNQPAAQRGQACVSVTSLDGCVAGPSCTDVVVTLVAVQPPLDPGPTLRVRKSPPADVALSWQEAPSDATHDAATAYDLLEATTGCGPFARLQRLPAAAGTNAASDPILMTAPRFRCYVVRSLNDGGASLPAAPDGSLCR